MCALAQLMCLLSKQAGVFKRNFYGRSFMDLVEEELSNWSDHLGKCNSSIFYIDIKINNNVVYFSLKYLSFASVCGVVRQILLGCDALSHGKACFFPLYAA